MKHMIIVLMAVFTVLIALFTTPIGLAVLLFLITIWLIFKPKKFKKMPVKPDNDPMKKLEELEEPEVINQDKEKRKQ